MVEEPHELKLELLLGRRVSNTTLKLLSSGIGVSFGTLVGLLDDGNLSHDKESLFELLDQGKEVAAIWGLWIYFGAGNRASTNAERILYYGVLPAASIYAGVYLGRAIKTFF